MMLTHFFTPGRVCQSDGHCASPFTTLNPATSRSQTKQFLGICVVLGHVSRCAPQDDAPFPTILSSRILKGHRLPIGVRSFANVAKDHRQRRCFLLKCITCKDTHLATKSSSVGQLGAEGSMQRAPRNRKEMLSVCSCVIDSLQRAQSKAVLAVCPAQMI